MSTPAIPQPAKTEIISAYLKTHERLIIVALAIALSAWGLSKYYDRAATLADARAVIADAHAAIVDKTAAQSLATLQLALAEKDATNLMLAQQNAALAAAITSRQTAVVVQQKKDATLPPTDLALKITALADAPPAEVTVEGDSIRLGRNASVSVAQALEVAPVLQASLNDETTIAKNTQVELDAANGTEKSCRRARISPSFSKPLGVVRNWSLNIPIVNALGCKGLSAGLSCRKRARCACRGACRRRS